MVKEREKKRDRRYNIDKRWKDVNCKRRGYGRSSEVELRWQNQNNWERRSIFIPKTDKINFI